MPWEREPEAGRFVRVAAASVNQPVRAYPACCSQSLEVEAPGVLERTEPQAPVAEQLWARPTLCDVQRPKRHPLRTTPGCVGSALASTSFRPTGLSHLAELLTTLVGGPARNVREGSEQAGNPDGAAGLGNTVECLGRLEQQLPGSLCPC